MNEYAKIPGKVARYFKKLEVSRIINSVIYYLVIKVHILFVGNCPNIIGRLAAPIYSI